MATWFSRKRQRPITRGPAVEELSRHRLRKATSAERERRRNEEERRAARIVRESRRK